MYFKQINIIIIKAHLKSNKKIDFEKNITFSQISNAIWHDLENINACLV